MSRHDPFRAGSPWARDPSRTDLMRAILSLDAPLAASLAPSSDVGAIDRDGRTALMLAARTGLADAVHDLLRLPGSMPLAVDVNGFSALHLAAFYGHCDCVEILLSACDPESVDVVGRTPLCLAASQGERRAALLLARAAALPWKRNRLGLSPVAEAVDSGMGACAAALLRAHPIDSELRQGLLVAREAERHDIERELHEAFAQGESLALSRSADASRPDGPASAGARGARL